MQSLKDTHVIDSQVEALRIEGDYLHLKILPLRPAPYLAGQYTSFLIPTSVGDIARYYSIASAPRSSGHMEFCILLGQDTETAEFYRCLQPKDHINISTPNGSFQMSNRSDKSCPRVFIAGGSGISPIRAMLQDLYSDNQSSGPCHLVYGCRSADGFPYAQEWKEMTVKWPQFKAWLTIEHSALGWHTGRVTNYLEQAALPHAEYYLCGPQPMCEATFAELKRLGVSEQDIFSERF